MSECGYPKGGFFNTLLSTGYARLAIDRFVRGWSANLGLIRRVEQGQAAKDAALLTLDGQKRSLLNDYILKPAYKGQPIVLNFGSYT